MKQTANGVNPERDRYVSVHATRQRVRGGLMLVWLILMPITLYYFSPYLPFMGLGEGIIAGSAFVFIGLFASSILFGRFFCGWLCPAGAAQDFASIARPKRVNRRVAQWIKYALWAPWLGAWVAFALSAAGLRQDGLKPDFFYQLAFGISVSRPEAYVIYLAVLTLVLTLAFAVGRRAECHTVCWMAPFMVLGQGLGKALRLPGLHIESDTGRCTGCGTCSAVCPMSLDAAQFARAKKDQKGGIVRIAHHDCVLCARCVDACPHRALRLRFGKRA